MEFRDFGLLGPVSALTLGGGGIGGVWGSVERDEAVATVRAAIDAGITMLDLAPTYGNHEAEIVSGLALRASPAQDVMVTTKVGLPDDEEDQDLPARMVASLRGSLDRLGRDHADLFLVHSSLRPAAPGVAMPESLGWQRYLDEVVPTFEKLRQDGTIRAWGLTGIGHPQAILDAIRGQVRPDAVQVVVNALDLSGDMWAFGDRAESRNSEIARVAAEAGVSVVAIRALAAGSLGAALDRPVNPDEPAALDFARAEGFRTLAAELGESPASLAHRYALSVPGVATVVLGVKNRDELAECVTAEGRGALAPAEMRAVLDLRDHEAR